MDAEGGTVATNGAVLSGGGPGGTKGGGSRPTALTVSDWLNKIGPGTFQWMAVVICGIGNASDAVELLAIEYILPQLKEVSNGNKGFLSASVFMGMLVGGLVSGVLSDKVGRKPCLMYSLGINVAFGLLSAFVPSWEWLVVCRICSGFGVGGSIPSVFTLYTEYLPMQRRGFFLTMLAWFWMVGSVFTASLAWILIGLIGAPWRLFLALCAAPALTAFVLTWLYLPESPRFLANHGKTQAAAESLMAIAKRSGRPLAAGSVLVIAGGGESGGGTGAEHEESLLIRASGSPLRTGSGGDASMGSTSPIEYGSAVSNAAARGGGHAGHESMWVLFEARSGLRRTTLLLMVAWFTLSFGWYGLVIWIPTLFKAVHFDLDIYQDSFMVAAANLPGNIVAALLMDRVGRKAMLSGTMFISSLLAVAFAASEKAWLTVAIACTLNGVSIGGWNALDCLSTESFPTSLRSSAMAVLAASGRLGSIAGQLVFGRLIDYGYGYLLLCAAAMLIVGSAAGAMLPRDTNDTVLLEFSEAGPSADPTEQDLEMRRSKEGDNSLRARGASHA